MLRSFLYCFFLVCLCTAAGLSAQNLTDDFSDGDLLNPDYLGDVDNFVVEDSVLRLMAPEAGSSSLRLPALTDPEQTVRYELYNRLDFSPSSSNYASWEMEGLQANGNPITYELRIGGISGDQDAVTFSATPSGGATTVMISGTPGAVGGTTAIARIRLERTADNVWTLLADYSGGVDFQTEGSAADPTGDQPATLNQFSITCNYTATRADKFYFDDLSIGPLLVDNTPPELLDLSLGGQDNQLVLSFSEFVTGAALLDLANYTLSPVGPDLQSVTSNGSSVTLTFAQDLPSGASLTLTIGSVADNSGNVANNLSASLTIPVYALPSAANLIISEFMADPTPEVGLPDAEYVEVHNRSDTLLRINDLEIASGGGPQTVEDFELPAGAYATIVAASRAALFDSTANVVTVPSLPALSNGGDEITLLYNGNLLHRIVYDLSWYRDNNKAAGGFSLELSRITADDLNCSGLWAASNAPAGGTPGATNSINGLSLDTEGPALLAATFVPGGIRLLFSERIDLASAPGAVFLEPNLGAGSLEVNSDGSYFLPTTNAPASGILYILSAEMDLSDCVGNFSDTLYQVQLGLAEEVVVGDVVINEVLFNPATGGSDFVELFNCSEKILNVDGWILANNQATSGSIRENIEADRLLLPGGYLVFTEDPADILSRYDQAQVAFLIDNELPSLANELGNISLISPNGDTLDSYDYREEQHSALLDDVNGVSLERLNPKAATQQDGNWFSAATSVGFATPTRENSQRRDALMTTSTDGFFFLDEDTFSPDGDGFQDVLFINYRTPAAGWDARLTIYDANGRLIRVLRRAELLAGEGTILWDGTTDNNERGRTGIYVIFIERFTPDGDTEQEKLVAVLVNE